MSKKISNSHEPRILNRRARHEYHVLEKLECGIILQGSEVKSVRSGQVQLGQGFARVEPRDLSLFLHGIDIAPYPHASGKNAHDPKRPRKLLAHKRQIAQLLDKTGPKGTTLVPLAMYFVRGRAKVELGLVTGKKTHDKRQDLKTREADRQIRRAMTRRRI